jgi:hypothetical protein
LSAEFVLEFFKKDPALETRYSALFDAVTEAIDIRSSPEIDF